MGHFLIAKLALVGKSDALHFAAQAKGVFGCWSEDGILPLVPMEIQCARVIFKSLFFPEVWVRLIQRDRVSAWIFTLDHDQLSDNCGNGGRRYPPHITTSIVIVFPDRKVFSKKIGLFETMMNIGTVLFKT